MDLLPGQIPFPLERPIPPALALPVGSNIVAIVRAVLIENHRFLLEIAGVLLEADIPATLVPGDHVRLRVLSAAPDPIVLEYTPPPAAEAHPDAGRPDQTAPVEVLRRLRLPDRPELRTAVEALLRTGVPLQRDLVLRVAELATPSRAAAPDPALAAAPPPSDPTRATAAAMLAAVGVDPVERDVERMARLLRPPEPQPPPQAPPQHRALQTLAETLERLSGAPARAEDLAALHAAPKELARIVREALDQSPILRRIDVALEALFARPDRAIPLKPQPEPAQPATPQLETARDRAAEILARILAAPDLPHVRAILNDEIPTLPMPLRAELVSLLVEREVEEIARHEELKLLRRDLAHDAPTRLAEPLERAAGALLAHRLAEVRGEGIQVLHVPIPFGDGRFLSRALIVLRRGRQGAPAHEGFESFTVDVDLSRLGRVVAHARLARRRISVRIGVATEPAARLLERTRGELAAALHARGFQAEVHVERREPPPPADLLWPAPSGGLDVRA